jgi:hypothetical protein
MSDRSGEQTAIMTTANHYLVVVKVRGRLAVSKRTSFPSNSNYQLVQNLLSSRPLSENVKIRIHKTIILPAFCTGVEHRLGVFENKVLRSIFGPKSNKVRGGWRKLYDEELHNLHSLPNIIRMIKSKEDAMLGGFLVSMACLFLRLQMEETPSSFGG